MWPCGYKSRDRNVCWLCICDCGQYKPTPARCLVRRDTQSCGCWNIEKARSSKHALKHGHRVNRQSSPEYHVWQNMHTRCSNPRSKDYPRYGDRGITVCPRWRASFSVWLTENGKRPTPEHTFDRIDNDKSYMCGRKECCGQDVTNCRWATAAEQSQNQTRTQLTPEIVRNIRQRQEAGESYAHMARALGKNWQAIRDAALGLTWSNVSI